jgi:succinate dehydrogenase/fumarate reductase flavoprotein subunit
MYPEYMQESLKLVEKTRSERLKKSLSGEKVFTPMTDTERDEVLTKFHPDYQADARRKIRIGINRGDNITSEIADLLESHSRINPDDFDLSRVDYDTDVLVIGGGGGGAGAALLARENGAKVIIATKLRIGDANSMMSQGGIQASVNPNDSPAIHYLDALGGGHFDNKPDLVRALVMDAPLVIKWLEELGVMFDKDSDGNMVTMLGGGCSRKRMHSARDYTGAAIMRVLRDEVKNHPEDIQVIEFSPAIELLMDERGQVAGAILYNLETEEYIMVRAKSTIIATGGFGRLHIKEFFTTNHYGATADGLVLGYRAGANLLYMDSVQYHPTGAVYPEQILGFLITEKVRTMGAQPVNKFGELFVFPLEPRDVESSSFIRECTERGKGITTPHTGRVGIWLDSPLIELINGEGAIQKQLPAMYRQYNRFNIDITKEPMLVFPTLHYQNGGLEINDQCETKLPNLYAAGEVSGGVHGRNRLMGNSVLDYNVFGRRAGIAAALNAKEVKLGKLTLNHIKRYERELQEAGIHTDRISPILLPNYTTPEVRARQLTAHYEGTLR